MTFTLADDGAASSESSPPLLRFPRPPLRQRRTSSTSSQSHESGALPRSSSSPLASASVAAAAGESSQSSHIHSGDGDSAKAKRRSVDCSTLTDLHSSTAVPEVEVISLLGEELPRYRLRADYLTEFGGYANSDFADASVIETPCLPNEDEKGLVGLTAEQAEATLEYLISSGYRLSQMTKTYHDVEAVTR